MHAEAIRHTLQQFETWYNQQNAESLAGSGLADDLLVIGPGLADWHFGPVAVQPFFAAEFRPGRTDRGRLALDLAKVAPRIHGDAAWVILPGTMTTTVPAEHRYAETNDRVKALLAGEAPATEQVQEAARQLARILLEAERGDEYIWPLRLEAVLTHAPEGCPAWQIRHLQISFSCPAIPEHRVPADSPEHLDDPFPARGAEVDTVRAVLQEYLDGYLRRDADAVGPFMDRLWGDDPLQSIVGTDPGEFFYGPEATRRLVENDWRHWGDFWFNVPSAAIRVEGDVAWIAARGRVTMKSFSPAKWGVGYMKWVCDQEIPPRRKTLRLLQLAALSAREQAMGEGPTWPVRLTAVLVKQDGRWQFRQMQYSDYFDGLPEDRAL